MKVTIECSDVGEAERFLAAVKATRAGGAEKTEPAAAPAAPAEAPPAAPDAVASAGVDANGMPWDETIHTSSRAQNADGSWKARKGKAAEAKAALADFKARGGAIASPAGGMPGTAAAVPATAPTGMPSPTPAAAPVADQRQEDMPPPISQQQLEEKVIGMLNRSTLNNDGYLAILTKHGVDLADPTGFLSTRETVRANMFTELCQIEPEVA